ncbi:hypothetical protein GQ53DRAFT_381427 [Thozetella sp. PMI_491]|nr:hypothetical protein GQ53DRAFT_381427 [Thozetella sp. PMI_491]
MESIQLAQMLADLSDLNAAQEAQAAVALVNANKTLAPPASDLTKPHGHPQAASAPENRHHSRVNSASGLISRTASPAKFDKFGRRILTPPITRSNSAHGSIPGTPRREAEHEDDISQATSLMALYEIRAKLKQQDNTSLMKVREKIAALQARQQAEKKEAVTSDPKANRFTYPKTN